MCQGESMKSKDEGEPDRWSVKECGLTGVLCRPSCGVGMTERQELVMTSRGSGWRQGCCDWTTAHHDANPTAVFLTGAGLSYQQVTHCCPVKEKIAIPRQKEPPGKWQVPR